MWDVLTARPRGRISQRILHSLATGLFVAILLCVGVFSKTAFAEDAVYSNGQINFHTNNFQRVPDLDDNDPRLFPKGTHAFSYSAQGSDKVEYIFIDGGTAVDQAKTGVYVTYTYKPPSTYTNQSVPEQVTITQNTNAPNATAVSSCNAFSGIGWIMCPVTSWLSSAVDGVFHFITMFLDTPPLTANSAIHDIWDVVRSFANICFVIVFLIIIYSQVTSMGISKYGIRTILPRLIVGAILVNMSYWICALAIDLSNFLGHSVQSFFMSYLESFTHTVVIPDWKTIAGLVVGGSGGVVVGMLWFSAATGGSLAAAGFILLSMLVSVALAALTALIVLAVRQAILIVFTIISPLAFVAMILPSTEKWFDKWKDIMLAMVIMFPMFGFLFGGSQVAGAAIILASNGNLFLLLLGKVVQLIPLAITPFLLKLSTGLLGTIAGMVNDRNRGLIDRTKNWSNNQAEHRRQRSIANPKNRRFNPFRWTAQRFDDMNRRQKIEMQGFEAASEARAMSGGGNQRRLRKYRNAYNYAHSAELDKSTEESNLKAQWDVRRRTDARTFNRDLAARAAESTAKMQAERLERVHADIVAEGDSSQHIRNLGIRNAGLYANIVNNARTSRQNAEEIAFESMAKKLAEAQQHSNVTDRLTSDAALRQAIGQIRGREGAQLVHAMAIADERKQYGEFVGARQEIMKHFKVSSAEISQLAKGAGNVTKTDRHGNSVVFDTNDEYTREAAIENVFQVGAYKDIVEVVEATGAGGANYDYRSTVLDALIKSGKSKAAPFLNDKAFDVILNGRYEGPATTRAQVVRRIQEGRLTASDLSSAHANALKLLFDSNDVASADWQDAHDRMFGHMTPADRAAAEAAYNDNYKAMRDTAIEVLRDPDIRQGTSRESINTIKDFLGIPRDQRLDTMTQDEWEAI